MDDDSDPARARRRDRDRLCADAGRAGEPANGHPAWARAGDVGCFARQADPRASRKRWRRRSEQKIVEETLPEIQPAPNPDVAIESPTQEVQRESATRRSRARRRQLLRAAGAPVQTAAIPGAPTQGRPVQRSTAIPNWTSEIVALLERNKRYPPAAQSRREHGVAQVVFTLDRPGQVVDSRVLHQLRSARAR